MSRLQYSRRSWIPALAVAVAVTAIAISASLTAAVGTARAATADPLSILPFFVQKDTEAAWAVRSYRQAGDVADAHLMERIADQSTAVWLAGGSSSIRELALILRQARQQHQLPTFVIYDIPGRDCGAYSTGGESSADAYEAWIQQIASHLGSSPVAVIIEPDALPELSCWSGPEQAENTSLIRYAATTLQASGDTTVYLDAGNPLWQPAGTMVGRLRRAGVGLVRGFAVNVSNFATTAKSIAYGRQISKQLGGKEFVIDTSRNGRGLPTDVTSSGWTCNPPGRGLGLDPTTQTASPLVDAYLWIKYPGESDGPCNGGPGAGGFWPSYALGLAKRAQQP